MQHICYCSFWSALQSLAAKTHRPPKSRTWMRQNRSSSAPDRAKCITSVAPPAETERARTRVERTYSAPSSASRDASAAVATYATRPPGTVFCRIAVPEVREAEEA
uniref:Uncharacterized protein n=1 Tax=Anopheles atroparvus TaxID=41427 RepID=A0AAG5D5V5_ANOAO